MVLGFMGQGVGSAVRLRPWELCRLRVAWGNKNIRAIGMAEQRVGSAAKVGKWGPAYVVSRVMGEYKMLCCVGFSEKNLL